jgi:hypothetical protein
VNQCNLFAHCDATALYGVTFSHCVGTRRVSQTDREAFPVHLIVSYLDASNEVANILSVLILVWAATSLEAISGTSVS